MCLFAFVFFRMLAFSRFLGLINFCCQQIVVYTVYNIPPTFPVMWANPNENAVSKSFMSTSLSKFCDVHVRDLHFVWSHQKKLYSTKKIKIDRTRSISFWDIKGLSMTTCHLSISLNQGPWLLDFKKLLTLWSVGWVKWTYICYVSLANRWLS